MSRDEVCAVIGDHEARLVRPGAVIAGLDEMRDALAGAPRPQTRDGLQWKFERHREDMRPARLQHAGRLGDHGIVVVDNGSAVPPRADGFPGVGLPVTVHRVADPTPSPVDAINHGLGMARGGIIGVWIDGARLASPGLVDACRRVLTARPRAIAATPNYHLGALPQYHPDARDYSAQEEDALLRRIGWPADGYRLFEIAHPAALSGVDGPILETNALFMTRPMWDELGGYDPAFASPGGGAANPDVLRRALALAGATLVKISGEATFHK
jgi:hypothetical protein